MNKNNRLFRWWPREDFPMLYLTGGVFFVLAGWWHIKRVMLGLPWYIGTFAVTPSVFSEINSWLPLAYRVSQGHLFPAQPSVNPGASAFEFYPYISLWIHGALLKLAGLNGTYWIGHVLIPLGCYAMLYAIFRRSLSAAWSTGFAFLSLFCFVPLPIRKSRTRAP